MARPRNFEEHQWLGDKRTQRVHNLDNIQPSCRLDDLMASEQYAAFAPDLLAEARNRGYRPHHDCAGGGVSGAV
jgi:hypothetical protein